MLHHRALFALFYTHKLIRFASTTVNDRGERESQNLYKEIKVLKTLAQHFKSLYCCTLKCALRNYSF